MNELLLLSLLLFLVIILNLRNNRIQCYIRLLRFRFTPFRAGSCTNCGEVLGKPIHAQVGDKIKGIPVREGGVYCPGCLKLQIIQNRLRG